MKQQKPALFRGSLASYEWQETDDGSQTLYSSFFDEACHSRSGAVQETKHNYIEGCRIREKSHRYSPLTVFEVGLGIGLGLRCTLEATRAGTTLHFISCELDEKLAWFAVESLSQDYQIKLEHQTSLDLRYLHGHVGRHQLTILLDDVRASLPAALKQSLIPPCHAIYQDPFSPKKNPRLWTREWFRLLKTIAHSDCHMATYSSTKAAWKAMVAGGWSVREVPGFGHKKLSTVACLQGDSSPTLLTMLEQSPTPAFTDENLS